MPGLSRKESLPRWLPEGTTSLLHPLTLIVLAGSHHREEEVRIDAFLLGGFFADPLAGGCPLGNLRRLVDLRVSLRRADGLHLKLDDRRGRVYWADDDQPILQPL